ncbi:hypothetical protein BOX15_Mlig016680g1 [Macrostomum lignano]|uniref:BED-type domain-containing protein n=1 Tax=Macrostomum lignano TaxID=282301 RepID=A0A267FVY6_9PLAT|nr:hypothetical protein BOX15_Mlig016680g1 [Macrostomum lignano]
MISDSDSESEYISVTASSMASPAPEPKSEQRQKNKNFKKPHPWPHLIKYFKLSHWDSETAPVFSCELCLPKKATIKGHVSSLNNLKSHISRRHSVQEKEFLQCTKMGIAKASTATSSATNTTAATSTTKNTSLQVQGQNPSTSNESFGPLSKVPKILVASPSPATTTQEQTTTGGAARHQRQLTMLQMINTGSTFQRSGQSVLQSAVDSDLVDYIVYDMAPFSTVESPNFRKFCKTLNPYKKIMSRRTLGRRVETSYVNMEQNLLKLLDGIPVVATTADCWSAHSRAYLGMTIHWLHPDNQSRQHAVLAFMRLKGHHTATVLAEAIQSIHAKFNIEKKVCCTTIDNGSNFVKAFVEFGSDQIDTVIVGNEGIEIEVDNETMPNEHAAEASTAFDSENPEQIEVTVVPIHDVLSEAVDEVKELPAHMRCAAHTFNLIATTDALKAVASNGAFRTQFRKTLGKAQALWNSQGRSTVAADAIAKKLGRRLQVPNATRWNSLFDSLSVLCDIFDKGKRLALNQSMEKLRLQIPPFHVDDVAFLKEYVNVMKPVAHALDIIQGETYAYLGILLPTVVVTRSKLESMSQTELEYCSSLVLSLLDGINSRFERQFNNESCVLAAAFHPMFRLAWLRQYDTTTKASSIKKRMLQLIEVELDNVTQPQNSSSSSSPELVESDAVLSLKSVCPVEFFSSALQPTKSGQRLKTPRTRAQQILSTWLDGIWKPNLGVSEHAFSDPVFFFKAFCAFQHGHSIQRSS